MNKISIEKMKTMNSLFIHNNEKLLTTVILIVIGLLLYGCQSKPANNQPETGIYYTCPMHHQIHSDKPGKCPICGMDLIKVALNSEQNIPVDSSLKYLVKPVTDVVIGNYAVISPAKLHFKDTIKAYGHIAFDEREVNAISTLTGGRIVKLFAKYNDQGIQKGQPLMKIYSPELISSQKELLQAAKEKDSHLIISLKQKLLNLGMAGNKIGEIIDDRQIVPAVTLFSPYSGIISSLNIREGAYVHAGQTVFNVQNINQTWAILNIFDKDRRNIHVGDKVLLSADADPDKIIKGEINFIPPDRKDNSKTTEVRVYISNHWKISTLIHGKIIADNGFTAWTVPSSAVRHLGSHAIVWVQNSAYPDVYQKRKVQIQEEIGGRTIVISGINSEDKIVENSAYLVGSDSFVE